MEHHPDEELQAVVDRLAREHRVPGAVVGILHGGRATVVAHGYSDAEHRVAVEHDTPFMIGSTTKTLTATAMMALVEQGKVGLDDMVRDHLPDLKVTDPTTLDVLTVGMLFDHRAGWLGDVSVAGGWGEDALDLSVRGTVGSAPQFVPAGTQMSYNNGALLVAGRIIEVLTGQSYEDAVRALVFAPLGMTNSGFNPWEAFGRRMALGHMPPEDVGDGSEVGRPLRAWAFARGMNPAGGAFSTAEDQLRYAAFHIDGTVLPAPGTAEAGSPPLTDAGRTAMLTPRVEVRSGLKAVGLSWMLRERDGADLVMHGGNVSALYLSSFAMVPAHAAAITSMTNSRDGGALGNAVLEWFLSERLGLAGDPPMDVQPLTDDLAAQYVGRYNAGQWLIDVSARDGKLWAQNAFADDAEVSEEFRKAFITPATPLVLVGEDIVSPAASPTGPTGDFGRAEDGTVAWFRHGLRLAPRLAPQP